MSTLEERTVARRSRLISHRAHSFSEAELWDLQYWQSLTPEERLSAHVAILRDVELVKGRSTSREDSDGHR
ncbi:MAG: hypothetical protein JXR45_05865 [Deltaproteobacteria bacterium]|nr:hypothetical protein [Deltaproteobacteria bacterium]